MNAATNNDEIERIKEVLEELQGEGTVLLAYLYGSHAKGNPHLRSDIDIAVYLNSKDEDERIEALDRMLIVCDREIEILFHDEEGNINMDGADIKIIPLWKWLIKEYFLDA